MHSFHWTVIGGGPAGIASLGQLLDLGVAAENILWIDPYFEAGDFGKKWASVSSNTRVQLFLNYLNACKSFNFETAPLFELTALEPDSTCLLKYMRDPLQWLTLHLQKKCRSQVGVVKSLSQKSHAWHIELNEGATFMSKNVILATGAKPSSLPYQGPEIIALEHIVNEDQYPLYFSKEDTVAVFGSSHSAIIALKHLCSLPVHSVINFYRAPLKFAVYLNDMILFDDSGLKGTTAAWAKANLLGRLPANLTQVYSNDENVERYLKECNKVIYATGFMKNEILITGIPDLQYDPCTGIIAPGLFGCGIAFPEKYTNRFGHIEYRVGVWKFMEYLQKIMPIWLKYEI